MQYVLDKNTTRVTKEQVHQGQILEIVTNNFLTSGKNREPGGRQIKLKKWEKIEIRYPYAWHFRTEDNIYFHATEEMITKNCILYGKIWENVRSSNKATLEDILRLWLYERIAKLTLLPSKICKTSKRKKQ